MVSESRDRTDYAAILWSDGGSSKQVDRPISSAISSSEVRGVGWSFPVNYNATEALLLQSVILEL